MKINEIKDITKLQGMVVELWVLLDHIDTLSDMCKTNDKAFRKLAMETQQKRHKILESDGYDLFLPKEGE